MKRRLVVALLLLAFLALAPSGNIAAPQNPPTRAFDGNAKQDFWKWLAENESTLRQGDACDVTFSWFNEDDADGPRSATHNLTTFLLVPADEESTRMIHDPQSGLDIRVGARYFPGYFKSSHVLRLALAFEGPPAGVFDELNSAQAEGFRYPGWRSLAVVKSFRVDRIRYTFRLSCQNGSEYLTRWRWMGSRPNTKPAKQ